MLPSRDRNKPCPCGSGKKYKKCCLKAPHNSRRLSIDDELSTAKQQVSAGYSLQALDTLSKILKKQPQNFEANVLASVLLVQTGDKTGAVRRMEKIMKWFPDHLATYFNLAGLFKNAGEDEKAIEVFGKAAQVQPDALEWQLNQLLLKIPVLIQDSGQSFDLHSRVKRALESMLDGDLKILNLDNVQANLFRVAYHGRDDKELLQNLSSVVRRKSQLELIDQRAPIRTRVLKKRIGFVSGFLHKHSIGKLNRGLIEYLSREDFEVIVIHCGGCVKDQVHIDISEVADEVVYLPTEIVPSTKLIRGLTLDIIHYLDIGMNSFSYLLAHFRLAQVQTTSWGHPITTGIETIDYFLSFGDAEPQGAEKHYSEKLIRLSRPPVYYEQPANEPVQVSCRDIGLPKNQRLYGCLQSLFKFHPDFDAVLNDILSMDPEAGLVLIESEQSRETRMLKERWARNYPLLLKRSVFLPRMSHEKFLAVCVSMEVLLDPLHFGSGNTLYETFFLGIPTVTYPREFMRSRIAAGLYKFLDIKNPPIADSVSSYAELAISLAKDSKRKQELKAEIATKSSVMYEDLDAIDEMGEFFLSAVWDR